MKKFAPLLLLLFGNEILSLAVITVYATIAAIKVLMMAAERG